MGDEAKRLLLEWQRREAAMSTAMTYINTNSAALALIKQVEQRTAAVSAAFSMPSTLSLVAALDANTASVRAITAEWETRRAAIEALFEPSKRVAAQLAELNRATDWWRNSIADQAAAITKLVDVTPSWLSWLDKYQAVVDAWMASVYPANWLDPEFPQLSQLVDLARDGYPVTWVPSGAVITALAQADPSQRRVVLLAHRQQILGDCATVVAEIDDHDLGQLTEKLTEAITAAVAGHDAAGQALATNIMDTGLRVFFPPASPQGYFKYVHVVNKINDVDPDACVMRELPRACVMWPVVPALQPFFGGTSRAEFNRHNTAHAVTAVQYSEPNMLISIMLATSLLRQLHHERQQAALLASTAAAP